MNRITVALVIIATLNIIATATSVVPRDSDNDVIHDHLVQIINNVTYDIIELQTAVNDIKRQHDMMRNDNNETNLEERKEGRADKQVGRLEDLLMQLISYMTIDLKSQVSVADDTAAKNRKDITVEDLMMHLVSYVTTDLRSKTHGGTGRDIDDLKVIRFYPSKRFRCIFFLFAKLI